MSGDDNAHASTVAAQLREAARDDSLPEEKRDWARERLEERGEDLDGDGK